VRYWSLSQTGEVVRSASEHSTRQHDRMFRVMTEQEQRVLSLIRAAFAGVALGEGVGLRQGQGLDDYADASTLALYRVQDEKRDWTAIPTTDLDQCNSSLSFFDSEGMRFHLPAYLVADLEGKVPAAAILFHLAYLANGAHERFEKLSLAQRFAVREFLLLRLSDPEREFEHPLIETALREYWVAPNEL
jgi:hypothetical protein